MVGTYNAGHNSNPNTHGGGTHSSSGGGGHSSGAGHSSVGSSGGGGHSNGGGPGVGPQTTSDGDKAGTPTIPKTFQEIRANASFKGIKGTKVTDSKGNVSYGGTAGHQFGGSISSGKGAKRKQTYSRGEKLSDTDRVKVTVAGKTSWVTPKKALVLGQKTKEATLKQKQYEGRAFVPKVRTANASFKGVAGTSVRDSSGNVAYGGSDGHQFDGSISGRGAIGGIANTVPGFSIGAIPVVEETKGTITPGFSIGAIPVVEETKGFSIGAIPVVEETSAIGAIRGLSIGTKESRTAALLRPKIFDEQQLEATITPIRKIPIIEESEKEKKLTIGETIGEAVGTKVKGLGLVLGKMFEKKSTIGGEPIKGGPIKKFMTPEQGYVYDTSIGQVKDIISKTGVELKENIKGEKDTGLIGPRKLSGFENMVFEPYGKASAIQKIEPEKKEGFKPIFTPPKEGLLISAAKKIPHITTQGYLYNVKTGLFDKVGKERDDTQVMKDFASKTWEGVSGVMKGVKEKKEVEREFPKKKPEVLNANDESNARKIANLRGKINYQRSLPTFQRDEKEIRNLEVESDKLRASLTKQYPGINMGSLVPTEIEGPMISNVSRTEISDVRNEIGEKKYKSIKEKDYEKRIEMAIKTGQAVDMTTMEGLIPTNILIPDNIKDKQKEYEKRYKYIEDLQIYNTRKEEGRTLPGEGDVIAKTGGIDSGREMIEFSSYYGDKLPEPIDIETSKGVMTVVPFAPIKEDMFASLTDKKRSSFDVFKTLLYKDTEGEKRKERTVDKQGSPIEERHLEELEKIREMSLSKQVGVQGTGIILEQLLKAERDENEGLNLLELGKEEKKKGLEEIEKRYKKDVDYVLTLEGDGKLKDIEMLSPKILELEEDIIGTGGRVGRLKDSLAKATLGDNKLEVNFFSEALRKAEEKHKTSPEIGFSKQIKDMEVNLTLENYPTYLKLIEDESKAIDDVTGLDEEMKGYVGDIKQANLDISELQEEQTKRVEDVNKLRKQMYEAKTDIIYDDPLEKTKKKYSDLAEKALIEGNVGKWLGYEGVEGGLIFPDIARKIGRFLTATTVQSRKDIKAGEGGKAALSLQYPAYGLARSVYDWTKPKEERYVDWDIVEGGVDTALLGYGVAAGFTKTVIGKSVGKAAAKEASKKALKRATITGGISLGLAGGGEAWQTITGKQTWQRGVSDTVTNLARLAILGKMIKTGSEFGASIKLKQLETARDLAIQNLLMKQSTMGQIREIGGKGGMSESVFLQQGKTVKSVKLKGTPYRMEYKFNPRIQHKLTKDGMTLSHGTMAPQYRIFKGNTKVVDWQKAPTVFSGEVVGTSPEGVVFNQQVGAPGRVPTSKHYSVGRDLYVMQEGKKVKYMLNPRVGTQTTETVAQIGGKRFIVHTGIAETPEPFEITKQQYFELLKGKALKDIFNAKDVTLIQKLYNMPGEGFTIIDKGFVSIKGGRDLVVGTDATGKKAIEQIFPFKGKSYSIMDKNIYGLKGTYKFDAKSPTGAVFVPSKVSFGDKLKSIIPSFSEVGNKLKSGFKGIWVGKSASVATRGGGDVSSTGEWTGGVDDIFKYGVGATDDVVLSSNVPKSGEFTGSADDIVKIAAKGGKKASKDTLLLSQVSKTGDGFTSQISGGLMSLKLATLPTLQYTSSFAPSAFGMGVEQIGDYFSKSEILPITEAVPQIGSETEFMSTALPFEKSMSKFFTSSKAKIIPDVGVMTLSGSSTVTGTVPIETTSTDIGVDVAPEVVPGYGEYGGGSLLGPSSYGGTGGIGWGLPLLLAGKMGRGRGGSGGFGTTGWVVSNPLKDLWGEFQQKQAMKAYQPLPTSREVAQTKVDTMFGAVRGLNADKATRVTTGGLTGLGAMAALQSSRQPMGTQLINALQSPRQGAMNALQSSGQQRGSADLFGVRNYNTKIAQAVAPMPTRQKVVRPTRQKVTRPSTRKASEARLKRVMASAPKKGKDPKVLSYRRKRKKVKK